MVCCKLATFVYIVSERMCAGLMPTLNLVVGDEGLFVLEVDLVFFLQLVCCLHASHVSLGSFSFGGSSFSLGGHSINVDLKNSEL
jgi:hypothetical protein